MVDYLHVLLAEEDALAEPVRLANLGQLLQPLLTFIYCLRGWTLGKKQNFVLVVLGLGDILHAVLHLLELSMQLDAVRLVNDGVERNQASLLDYRMQLLDKVGFKVLLRRRDFQVVFFVVDIHHNNVVALRQLILHEVKGVSDLGLQDLIRMETEVLSGHLDHSRVDVYCHEAVKMWSKVMSDEHTEHTRASSEHKNLQLASLLLLLDKVIANQTQACQHGAVVLAGEHVAIENQLALLLLRADGRLGLHVWLDLDGLRVAVDQRQLALDHSWVGLEEDLAKELALAVFSRFLEVLHPHVSVLVNIVTNMQSLVGRQVRNGDAVGAFRRGQVKNLGIELLLDLIERLIFVRLAEYHDDQSCELGDFEQGALLGLVVNVHFPLDSEGHDENTDGSLSQQ